jgi:hypothetical protein
LLKDGVVSDPIDATLLWRISLNQSVQFRKKYIVFKNVNYIISNWTGDEFPNILYIVCPDSDIDGYKKKNGVTSERVAALELA